MRNSDHFTRVCKPCAAAGIVLTLWSCGAADGYFDRYLGVNLFTEGQVNWIGWEADQPEDYLYFAPVSGETASAPPAGTDTSSVYRLEVRNLVPDGDFESVQPPKLPTGWSFTAEATVETREDPTGLLSGAQSAYFSLVPEDVLWYDLTASVRGITAGISYGIRFDFVPQIESYYQFHHRRDDDRTQTWTTEVDSGKVGTLLRFPFDFENLVGEFFSGGTSDRFEAAERRQEAFFDRFRIVRTDIVPVLSLAVPFADPLRASGLEAVSGWYRFSVYVRQEASPEPNRFNAHAVTIRAHNSAAVFAASDAGADWSQWTRISLVFEAADIRVPENGATAVFRVSISPTDSVNANMVDAGSILVAAPRLELLPGGPSA